MSFAKGLLWTNSILFVVFDIGFVTAPQALAALITGGPPDVPSAIIDMRAMYGGMSHGVGLFFGVSAWQADWVRPGLVASLLLLAAVAASRAIGILMDGSPNGLTVVLLLAEVLFVGLAAIALRQVSRETTATHRIF